MMGGYGFYVNGGGGGGTGGGPTPSATTGGGGGGGGSSSSSLASSNLSALAPPFTVDWSSLSKPQPLVDFSKLPDQPIPIPTTTPYPTFPCPTSIHNCLNNTTTPPSSTPDFFPISEPPFNSPAPAPAPAPAAPPSPSIPNPYHYYYYAAAAAAAAYSTPSPIPTSHVPHMNPLSSTDPHFHSTDPPFHPQRSSTTSLVEACPYYPSSSSFSYPNMFSGFRDSFSTSHLVPKSNALPRNDYNQTISFSPLGDDHHTNPWGEGQGQGEAGGGGGGGFLDSLVGTTTTSFFTEHSFTPSPKQGLYESKGSSICEEGSRCIDVSGTVKSLGSATTEKLVYKSFSDQNSNFMTDDHPKTSTLASTSLNPEAYSPVPSPKAASTGKPDTGLDDIRALSIMNNAFNGYIRQPVRETSSFQGIFACNDRDDTDLARHNPFSSKDSYPCLSSRGNVQFDPTHVRFHLDQINKVSAELPSCRAQLPMNRSAPMNGLGEFPTANGFNAAIDNAGTINTQENYSRNLDPCNPVVDSPCWKGAMLSYPPDISEAANPPNTRKVEVWDALHCHGLSSFSLTANDTAKISHEKPGEKSVTYIGSLEDQLAPPSKHSASDVLLKEGIDDATKSESPLVMHSDCHGLQISGANGFRQEHMLSIKSKENSNLDVPRSEQQSVEEGICIYGKSSAQLIGADAGVNINSDPDECSTHVQLHAGEHVLCSAASAEDASTSLTKSPAGEPMSKTYITTLVHTMHNLSELLLFLCSDGACEFGEEVFVTLKNVINNLDTCILKKNNERTNSMKESFIPPSAIELHKGTHFDTLIESGEGTKFQGPVKCQHCQKDHSFKSGKQDDKLSYYASIGGDADILKTDNMIQEIKKVLTDNFHVEEEMHPQAFLYKNLWLEAEASLCSVSCISRFNRMKMEMEKCNLQNSNGNTMFMENLSRSSCSSDLNAVSPPAADTKSFQVPDGSMLDLPTLNRSNHSHDVMARFCILKSRADNANTLGDENFLSPKVPQYLNMVEKLACEPVADTNPGIPIPGSPVSSTSSCADDVMARFCSLNSRVNKINSPNTLTEENFLSPKVALDLNKVENSAWEAVYDTNPGIPIPDSPVTGTTGHADDVMARFRILNSRAENFYSSNTLAEENLLSHKLPLYLNKVDTVACKKVGDTNAGFSIPDSPVCSMTRHPDGVEASVMARFNILKRRVDNSSSKDIEEHKPKVGNIGFSDLRRPSISEAGAEERVLDVSMEKHDHFANPAGNGCTVKEFHLFVNDDPLTPSHKTKGLGNQSHSAAYDSSSSEWEHVLKEELAEQNC